MRRFRMPTIPNMGLPSSNTADEESQACDSGIFADAEEEYSHPEKRPTAPYMSGLRRRNAHQEESRYEDAYQSEEPLKKHPSGTTKMKNLTSLARRKEGPLCVEKSEDSRNSEEDEVQIPNHEQAAGGFKPTNVPGFRQEEARTPTPAIAGPLSQSDVSNQTKRYSSNDTDTRPRKRILRNELYKPVQMIYEIASKLRNRLLRDELPRFKQKAQEGLALLIANIFALFSFLKWASLTLFRILNEFKVKMFQPAERTNIGSSSGADQSEGHRKGTEMESTRGSTMKDEEERFSCDLVPQKQTSSVVHDKATKTSGPEMSEETIDTMATVPRPPSFKNGEEMHEDQHADEHHNNKTNIAPNNSKADALPRCNSRKVVGINETNYNAESRADCFNLEQSNEAESRGRNLDQDLLNELDQSNLRFEQGESEIVISPLESTTRTNVPDGQPGVGNMNGTDNIRRQIRTSGGPGLSTSDMNELEILPGKSRSSRGSTGKLKSDVRTMKESLFRVLGRNKIEPETRFASPRSTRKTLTLVADMLVKEYDCDVAVRRNGALKIRCEKTFPGNRKLKVRLAFQSMNEFSCNVIVSRSRDDGFQVSTTDYVSFVADLQRSFLNATSEGKQGTHGG